jgi:hypothetical protein
MVPAMTTKIQVTADTGVMAMRMVLATSGQIAMPGAGLGGSGGKYARKWGRARSTFI